ncbi:glycosyltransferase family 4 protein [Dokdonia sp. 4H-3-7-5]|uniref:glycosyltransferase family 4 protein n=1 Tax=Dokdonia sp. (strain 4H-3-7-5) TaxID=983548 RepID=UPI00020A6DE2|nr:glycosyltransferase family 4 protein [Dokdonia sp. 4H-3-7-5]AEE20748.1 glycosyl transferase group 1 [Dokdonia sp. 4H-3-7-5]
MDKINKIKIIWLCSFTSSELQSKLSYSYHPVVSPWISDLIELFRHREDIELTIISPNYYTNNFAKTNIGNIKIILYKYRSDYLPAKYYNLKFNFRKVQKRVNKLIKGIAPHLIHLHGSENPLYAVGVLRIKSIPILITVQGFVHLSRKPRNILKNYVRWNRIRIENKINSEALYFTNASQDVYNILRIINKNAKIYSSHYPTKKPKVKVGDTPVIYDLVYYARITKDKGIEDFIDAIALLKFKNPRIQAIIIGGGSNEYVLYIKNKISSLGLDEAIVFAGYQETQEDVFRLAISARLYVLPTHFDGLPGSLREAMFMRLPIVANAVGGIPELNRIKECVVLSKNGDVNDLANKIELVLSNKDRRDTLIENAYELITSIYDNSKIPKTYLDIYQAILSEQKNKNIL